MQDEPTAAKPVWEYDTPTGRPCPRTVRPDGSIDGDGACHQCGMGPACPLFDPWAESILD